MCVVPVQAAIINNYAGKNDKVYVESLQSKGCWQS